MNPSEKRSFFSATQSSCEDEGIEKKARYIEKNRI
jgi:hypothetical protein